MAEKYIFKNSYINSSIAFSQSHIALFTFIFISRMYIVYDTDVLDCKCASGKRRDAYHYTSGWVCTNFSHNRDFHGSLKKIKSRG